MTRPLDTCWAVVMPHSTRPRTIPRWIGSTRTKAIGAFLSIYDRAPYNTWRYHYRRGMRCIRVDVVPHQERR